MADSGNRDALNKATSLMNYLAEVTDAAERDPVRDILSEEAGAPEALRWLDELPDGVWLSKNTAEGVLLRVEPPKTAPVPKPSADLADWLDSEYYRRADGPEPVLPALGPITAPAAERTEPPNSITRAFSKWLADWRRRAEKERRSQDRRKLYEALDKAAKTLESQDDEYEFVLAVGLVRWQCPDGTEIRRHLVTKPVIPKLDRRSAEVTVSFGGGKRRFEDKELFTEQPAYQPDRARAARQAVLDSENGLLDSPLMSEVREWLELAVTEAFEADEDRAPGDRQLPLTPAISASPALMLRPRSRRLLAEAYKDIAEALLEPGAQVPVALAQLLLDTEREQRDRWLSDQGAATGDVLGKDPLFPLPANDEQMHVIELLRTETGVVVQGPPGTGKTHTIANLVSALLARGQRVLVTSQKDQALKVLREKIPAELRRLCVLLAGGSKDAAKELEQGLDSLSEAMAMSSGPSLAAEAKALSAEREGLFTRSVNLNNRIKDLRDVENVRHDPVVPGYRTDAYTGTLTEIVREVKRHDLDYAWFPHLDAGQPDVPPLSTQDMIELVSLLRKGTPSRRLRAEQEFPAPQELPRPGELAEILASEQRARETAHEDTSQLTQRLATAGAGRLQELLLLGEQSKASLRRLGFGENCLSVPDQQWIAEAVGNRLAGRYAGLWGHLFEVRDAAGEMQERLQAQGVGFSVEMPTVTELGLGKARGLLRSGAQLRAHLAEGGKIRKKFMKSAAQKESAELLAVVRVDGLPPTELPQLDAAITQLEAAVAAAQLVEKWADVGVRISTDRLTRTLSELDDNSRLLSVISELAALHIRISDVLAQASLPMDISTVTAFVTMLDTVPAAMRYVELEHARTQVSQLHQRVRTWSAMPLACPELDLLTTAVTERDLDGYTCGLAAVELARSERDDELRQAQLARNPQIGSSAAGRAGGAHSDRA